MSYDIKYRQRAIDYWQEGHSKIETAKVFKVSPTTLQTWKSRLIETGTLEKSTRKETWRKIEPAKLEKYIEEHPDAYLSEIAEVFDCSSVAVYKALERLKITRKKNNRIQGNK